MLGTRQRGSLATSHRTNAAADGANASGRGTMGLRRSRTFERQSAFDEYRAEALRRLEEEQREFMAFLDRLRLARDKVEFDQFMAEHGRRPNDSGSQPPAG